MRRSLTFYVAAGGIAFLVGLIGTVLWLRVPAQRLTPELLEAARDRWREAAIDDYQLHYRMYGSEYRVRVESGIVVDMTVNGRPASTSDPAAYSIDGLLATLAQELDNLSDPTGPFAGRAGNVIMRAHFHPELGYPERYLRSGGGGRSVALEMLEFRPQFIPADERPGGDRRPP